MSDQIDADPFWSVVHRRHPDLDIVLLPPDQTTPADSGQDRDAPEPFAHEHLSVVDDTWARLVGHGMPSSVARWIPGPTSDSVCHSVTLTLGDADEAIALAHLRSAADVLTSQGWRVFLPPTGMPRIMADRPSTLGDEQLLFGYAAKNRNLFLRLNSTGLPVGSQTAYELIEAA